MLRKMVIAAGLAAIALTASACNTVKGLGRDIESVGQSGEDAINK
ncbi:MAG: Entericidin EcnA/B family protein [Sphingomonadales bacterium 63-6]|nr:MAG: Entericidin EcnA/B family protein [Sphingomonadales bacterium 63-6]